MSISDEQIKALRPGDVVLVRAVIVDPVPDCDGDIMASTACRSGANQNSYIDPANIISIEPRPFAVGDRVRDGVVEWEVAAPPRKRSNGKVEVAVWNDEDGYTCSVPDFLTLVP